ncbi:hypothetical protein Bbelb_048180 [Branchiostoma belcheri]|nr:hypothetical protein Bbelb_048180 [Branchiostoma belcheri]
MQRYVDTIITPYMEAQRDRLGLEKDQKGLKPYSTSSCTGDADADGGINVALKEDLRQSFMTRYSETIAKEIADSIVESAKVDLRLSTLKPMHANWFLGAMNRLGAKKELIMRGGANRNQLRRTTGS